MTSRKVIREQVKAALLHCVTFAGPNIFTSRARTIDDSELPAILIYTPSERVSIFNASPLEYERVCAVKIEILVAGGDEVEDTLDDYAKLIEQALIYHDTLNDNVDDIILQSIESELKADGEKIAGGIGLTFEATYRTMAVNEGDDENHNSLVPFVTANTVHKHVGTLGDSPAAIDNSTLDQGE